MPSWQCWCPPSPTLYTRTQGEPALHAARVNAGGGGRRRWLWPETHLGISWCLPGSSMPGWAAQPCPCSAPPTTSELVQGTHPGNSSREFIQDMPQLSGTEGPGEPRGEGWRAREVPASPDKDMVPAECHSINCYAETKTLPGSGSLRAAGTEAPCISTSGTGSLCPARPCAPALPPGGSTHRVCCPQQWGLDTWYDHSSWPVPPLIPPGSAPLHRVHPVLPSQLHQCQTGVTLEVRPCGASLSPAASRGQGWDTAGLVLPGQGAGTPSPPNQPCRHPNSP